MLLFIAALRMPLMRITSGRPKAVIAALVTVFVLAGCDSNNATKPTVLPVLTTGATTTTAAAAVATTPAPVPSTPVPAAPAATVAPTAAAQTSQPPTPSPPSHAKATKPAAHPTPNELASLKPITPSQLAAEARTTRKYAAPVAAAIRNYYATADAASFDASLLPKWRGLFLDKCARCLVDYQVVSNQQVSGTRHPVRRR